jgi:hypothetical protein
MLKNKIFALLVSLILISGFALVSPKASFAQCAAGATPICDVPDHAPVGCPSASNSGVSCAAGVYWCCVSPGATMPPPAAARNDALGSGGCGSTEFSTAIGCIPTGGKGGDSTKMLGFFMGWAVGIGGGLAFLLIVYSGFLLMTSSGNPQRVQAGKELLGAAVGGLLLLIFSVVVLRIIGVDILGLF